MFERPGVKAGVAPPSRYFAFGKSREDLAASGLVEFADAGLKLLFSAIVSFSTWLRLRRNVSIYAMTSQFLFKHEIIL